MAANPALEAMLAKQNEAPKEERPKRVIKKMAVNPELEAMLAKQNEPKEPRKLLPKREADPFEAGLAAMMMGGAGGRRGTGESIKPKPKTQKPAGKGGVDFFGNPIEGGEDELEAISEIEFMPSVTR